MENKLPGSDAFEKEVQSITSKDPFDLLDAVRAAAKKHLGSDCGAALQPFGVVFMKNIPMVAAGGISTTKTVSATLTIPPDTDTDPEDTD